MGMLPSYIRLVASMHSRYRFEGPVCSLGNQDIWASHEDLKRYFKEVRSSYEEPNRIIGHSSRTFNIDPSLMNVAQDFVHARVFFEMLGIQDYEDMDKFDSDNPTIVHDLNVNIPIELEDRFGLIFDGGTVEHIFDVRRVLENIIRLLKINGCVIHICSFQMDHGFYAFSPSSLFDFYAVNGFSNLECFLMEVDYTDIIRTYNQKHRYIKYEYGMTLRGLLDVTKEILVFFVGRKTESLPELVIPTQGIYDRRGNISDGSPNHNQSFFERIVPNWIQPIASPLRPILRAAYRAYLLRQNRRKAYIGYI